MGEHGPARQGPGRQPALRGHVALLDDPPHRAGQGALGAHRVLQADRGELRRRSRQVDSEKPMVKIDGSKPGDTTVTYDKMGWVMWMLLQQMGRENLLRGPARLPDGLRREPGPSRCSRTSPPSCARYAPDPMAYDAFIRSGSTRSWCPSTCSTEARKSRARRRVERDGQGHEQGHRPPCPSRWRPCGASASTRRVPPRPATRRRAPPSRWPRASRSRSRIHCAFEPEQVVVDPDARVLQLRRKTAVAKVTG